MKPKASPLHILDFAIIDFQFEMVFPDDVETDVTALFKNYSLDIDFGLNNEEFIRAFIKADINKDKELFGYKIYAEAVCIFEFDKNMDVPEDVRKSMEGFSTIYIALNSLRGLISNFTANAPFGRYILPSIDLNDLIEMKKKKATDKKKENKKNAPKKSVKQRMK